MMNSTNETTEEDERFIQEMNAGETKDIFIQEAVNPIELVYGGN